MNRIFATKKSKVSWLALAVGGACLSGCGGGGGTGPTPPPSAKEQIVFTSNRDGNSEIYLMDIDGTNQRRLTNNPARDLFPTLNMKTGRVAFESNRADTTLIDGAIYITDLQGQEVRKLFAGKFYDGQPSFSRDGSKIALSRSGTLYIVGVDGSNPIPIKTTGTGPSLFSPSFHPNGRSLVFVDYPADGVGGSIYTINIDSTGIRELTPDSLDNDSPRFSPDGNKIVFSRVLFEGGVQNSEIYIINADGSNPVRLTRNVGRDDSPSFTADGSKIVFSSRRDGNGEIYIMNADGTNPTRLTNNPAEDDLPSTS